MLGYDSSWASFPVIEVMSQPRFAYKRIGYLAASQTFTKDTDVILLCTQLFSREFTGTSNPCVARAMRPPPRPCLNLVPAHACALVGVAPGMRWGWRSTA